MSDAFSVFGVFGEALLSRVTCAETLFAAAFVRRAVSCQATWTSDRQAKGMDVVWLKRDVRLGDHAPLARAAGSGRPFVILFIYEPDQLAHESTHGSHIAFVNEGLADMDSRLQALSGASACVTTRYGEATEVLSTLHRERSLVRLLSHQETGHGVSYERDRRVASWCRQHGVEWLEMPQSTVVRGLSPSDGTWNAVWRANLESFMSEPPPANPMLITPGAHRVMQRLVHAGGVGFLGAEDLEVAPPYAKDRAHRQQGGETRAMDLLASFLGRRAERYSGGISSPNEAWTACSRLSPYLAWGNVSLRTVMRATRERRLGATGKWARSLDAFLKRFTWRGHNCQRFEMRCWMEHRSLCEAWEHLREGRTFMYGDPALLGDSTEAERLAAFEEGRTGYPLVDACMRCLLVTGWLNFRMRCMLVSFAVYNLWLDWRAIAGHMARCFLDFEPGIHFSQLQMQAGTTGVDMRCYSMTKQAKEQDPRGIFIRQYVPELATCPHGFVHEPWKLDGSFGEIGGVKDYPKRIVDETRTAKASKSTMSVLRKWVTSGAASRGESPPASTLTPEKEPPAKRLRGHGQCQGDGLSPSPNIKDMLRVTLGRAGDCDLSLAVMDINHLGERVGPTHFSTLVTCSQEVVECQGAAGTTAPAAVSQTSWSCPKCTFITTALAQRCEACGSQQPGVVDGGRSLLPALLEVNRPIKREKTAKSLDLWTCPRCTFVNGISGVPSATLCEICDASRPLGISEPIVLD